MNFLEQNFIPLSSGFQRSVLVLVGPTASGKTQTAIAVAEKLDGEIISADSRQIYKYLDIGTAKPSKEQQNRVKHYFIDELFPEQEFNAGEFGKRGRVIIDDIFKRGKTPIVVGGSGLYIHSLIFGFFDGPSAVSEIRKQLYHRLHDEGIDKLLEELRRIDPASAERMLPSNIRRIVRALEVYYVTSIPLSKLQSMRVEINFVPFLFGLQWDRKVLYERINARVDLMVKMGLIEEVRNIKSKGYNTKLNSLQTVGYKEVFDYLDGRTSYNEMVNLIKLNTRRFAKRQMTWFRRYKGIRWFEICNNSELQIIADKICQLYRNSRE